MLKKAIIFLTTIMVGCSTASQSSSTSSVVKPTKETTKESTPATSEPKATTTPNSSPSENTVYGVTKLISLELADGWEVVPDGYDSPYTYLYQDWVTIQKDEAKIQIEASLDSYGIGLGGDPYIEGKYTYGDYWYSALRTVLDYGNDQEDNIIVDETTLSLEAGGYIGYIFEDYGIMSVTYTNPDGAYADDKDLVAMLNTLHVKDSYGEVKILADKINIRYGNSVDAEKVGTVKKGEKYKVRAIQQDDDYTWYAIGFKDGDPNGGSLTWIADKDGKWIKYTAN